MKLKLGSITMSCCAAMLFLACPTAQGQELGFYLKADLGGTLTQDTDVKAPLSQQAAQALGVAKATGTVQFDPGVRLGFTAGYQVTKWFGAEAELGAFVNTIQQSGAGAVGRMNVGGSTYANVPLLFNLRLQYPNQSRWMPYIGGGLGVSAAIVDFTALTASSTFDTFVRVRGSDATAVFAYQAFAGLRYRLSDRTGLSLEYRYFVAESPRWKLDFDQNVMFDATQTHALSLAFNWSF